MTWNFNMDEAPRGSWREVERTIGKNKVVAKVHEAPPIIAADSSGTVVTLSRWVEKDGRWNMFTKDAPPVAWKPWPVHPFSEQVPA